MINYVYTGQNILKDDKSKIEIQFYCRIQDDKDPYDIVTEYARTQNKEFTDVYKAMKYFMIMKNIKNEQFTLVEIFNDYQFRIILEHIDEIEILYNNDMKYTKGYYRSRIVCVVDYKR